MKCKPNNHMVFLEVNKQPNPKNLSRELGNKCKERYKGFCGLPIFFFFYFQNRDKRTLYKQGPRAGISYRHAAIHTCRLPETQISLVPGVVKPACSSSLHEDFSVRTTTVGNEGRTEPHGTPCETAWTAAKYVGEGYDREQCAPQRSMLGRQVSGGSVPGR